MIFQKRSGFIGLILTLFLLLTSFSHRGIGKNEDSISVKKFVVQINRFSTESDGFYENTYIVFDEQSMDAIIIDPGTRDKRIDEFIHSNRLNVRKIFNTHGHVDHTGANRFYARKFNVYVLGSRNDLPLYKDKLKPHEFYDEEGILQIGSIEVNVFFTPGHTPGGVCLLISGHLFSGDTIFKNSIGKVHGRTRKEIGKKSIAFVNCIKKKILGLPDHTPIFPGHGISTTISYEKKNNPYLNRNVALKMIKNRLCKPFEVKTVQLLDKGDLDIRIVFKNIFDLTSFQETYGEILFGLKLLLQTEIRNK